ncbi:hypothetical protein EMIT074MI3_50106 [Bacillus licheniformis]
MKSGLSAKVFRYNDLFYVRFPNNMMPSGQILDIINSSLIIRN